MLFRFTLMCCVATGFIVNGCGVEPLRTSDPAPNCPGDGEAERNSAGCAWLAYCVQNNGLCASGSQGEIDFVAIQNACVEVATAAPALTNILCIHDGCEQTINFVNDVGDNFMDSEGESFAHYVCRHGSG